MDRANGSGPGAGANRAERFEDEKRRIIESCFNKKESDGSLIETYITHVRITEFSSHPTTPPPPQARTPDSEKPRVIIVAVRKSGRVRMHKSKENTNQTFSIGKTWNLDDLSQIESYTGPQVPAEQANWASNTGFLVTLGKPYFWQAQTDKEKKFFIASLIKIYGKYTGGKTPELSGFDQKELDQVLGAGRRLAGAGPSAGPPPPRPPPPEALPSQRSNISTASLSNVPEPPRIQKTSPVRSPPPNGVSALSGGFDSPSRDRMRAWANQNNQNNQSQDSLANSMGGRSEDTSSIPPRSRNGMPGSGSFSPYTSTLQRDNSDLQQHQQQQDNPQPPSRPPSRPSSRPQPSGEPPPERRRPPMDPTRPLDRDLVPPPLMSQAPKRDLAALPLRNVDRALNRKASAGHSMTGQSDTSSMVGSLLDREVPLPTMSSSENMKSDANKSDTASVVLTNVSMPNTRASSPTIRTETPIFRTETPPPPMPKPPAEPEDDRPGLGPMIRNKKSKGDIAGAFWKAASAANAFRPRPGGAGDRLRQTHVKSAEGPDGITGVVPARPRPESRDAPPVVEPKEPPPEPPKPAARSSIVPEVKITVPNSSRPNSRPPSLQPEPKELVETRQQDESLDQSAKRRSIVAGNDVRYLQALGIDPTILDARTVEFGKWLDYFGWVPGVQMRTHTLDEIKVDLERELNKAQAGGWLARFREEDERVDAIKSGLDLAMTECEELDNLLTLYAVELSTLSEDIAYIEAQGQGLQVQTSNQKLLKNELESLLQTCDITTTDLEALQIAPLDNMRGLENVESALVTLFKAMTKIDPSLGGESDRPADATMDLDQGIGLDTDFGKMRIVQEKKEMYRRESLLFMQRLMNFMSRQFEAACSETKRALDGALSKKVDPSHHDAGRGLLWKYSPLMLYTRVADLSSWDHLLQTYQERNYPLYKREFQNVIAIWRKNARKPTGEEAELLFSYSQEKKDEGVATTARKMTVKRSQTLAKALRSPLADSGNRANTDKSGPDSRSTLYEVFAGVLVDLLPLVEMEQNFIVDFFHASTLEQVDFPDAVDAAPPRERRGGDLKTLRAMEPDRDRARRITRLMELIYSFFEQELQALMEWVIGQSPLQGVGVFVMLEKQQSEYSQSNQDFLNNLLDKLHSNLDGRFRKFMDEQIRAIEETKVKISKRKGVIQFFKVFPTFSTTVENMLEGIEPNLRIRRTIDREYERVLRSMFDSLMVIARENPTVGVGGGGVDPEDKEALNFHILLIENMNHFIEETATRDLQVLEKWKDQAESQYLEHMGLYVDAATRRPLGKLLEYLENIEEQIKAGKTPSAIAAQPSNSKNIFNKILGNYDTKEVRKGIEALRKRVEKHFGDADDPSLSRSLVVKVSRECEKYYSNVENRIGWVTTNVYGGDVLFEWPRTDVKAAFK